MANLCFYISDYGYGHASRSIAVIRRLAAELVDSRIYVRTGFPYDFTRQSLRGLDNVEVLRCDNDVGVVTRPGGVLLDRDRTHEALRRWVSGWDSYLEREELFCVSHEVGLILTDVAPQPLEVAGMIGIPGIAISNFTWHYIFSGLFPGDPAVDRLRDAYAQADLALVLPFSEPMEPVKRKVPVSLTSRRMTEPREALRRKHDLADADFLVYLGTGMSLDSQFLGSPGAAAVNGWRFVVSSNHSSGLPGAIRIPGEQTEAQDYIGMCDLVVSKTGYSTVSEAIRARVPMLLFRREGFGEDRIITDTVERLGIGSSIDPRSAETGDWAGMVENLGQYAANYDRLEERFIKDGTSEVVNIIKDFL